MPGPVDHLSRLADILRVAAPGDPAVAWFDAGLREHLRVGGPRLDEALGLRQKTNGRSPASVWLFQRRDGLIRAAAASCPTVERFLDEMLRFERDTWPTWRGKKAAPKNWPTLDRDLFALFKVGVPIPRSCRRLQQILASETSSATGCADALALLFAHDQKKRRSR